MGHTGEAGIKCCRDEDTGTICSARPDECKNVSRHRARALCEDMNPQMRLCTPADFRKSHAGKSICCTHVCGLNDNLIWQDYGEFKQASGIN